MSNAIVLLQIYDGTKNPESTEERFTELGKLNLFIVVWF